MENITKEFITAFHTLDGITLTEKKQSLFKLLQAYSSPELSSSIDFSHLKAKTYLEHIFLVDVLIYFHKTTELLKIFNDGDEISISKMIKTQWFLEEVFKDVTPKLLVQEHLPNLPFSVRNKVLKRVASIFSEKLMDDVFEQLLDRYGISSTLIILPDCSKTKIKTILKDNQIQLSSGQLKILFMKDKELISLYLTELKKSNIGQFEDKKLLTYIAQKDPEYFWTICENFNCKVKLGSRTTKKMLIDKEHILTNEPQKYVPYFRQDRLVRKLCKKNIFKDIFQNVFPKTKAVLKDNYDDTILYKSLLKYYPKSQQYFLFESTFKKVLGETLQENITLLNNNLLDYMKDATTRENLAIQKYNETRDVDYIKYFKIEKSIPEIKDKINATSCAIERAKLIKLLLSTCQINNDLLALEQVLKYFTTRHRHDDKVVRDSFLSTILDQYRDHLDDFNENHWNSINEVLVIRKINNEYLWEAKRLDLKYLEFLFKNNQLLEKNVTQLINNSGDHYYAGDLDGSGCVENPDFEKKVFEYAIIHFSQNSKDDDKDFLFSQPLLVYDINEFNSKNPGHQINILENEMYQKYILRACKEDSLHYRTAQLVGSIICKSKRNHFETELIQTYFVDTFRKCPYNKRFITWFLKNEPDVLEKYAENIVKDYISFRCINWKEVRKYNHIGLDKKFIQVCKNELADAKVRPDIKTLICEVIAYLMPSDEYLEYCNEMVYKPSVKIDFTDQQQAAKYTVSRELIKNMRYTPEPKKVLPFILEYVSSRDYLISTLPAMYKTFFKIPENLVALNLNKLTDKNISSVSKHAVFLSAIISSKIFNLELYESLLKRNNSESHKNVFRSSLKYFVRNPCPHTLAVTSQFLDGLNNSDDESFKLIVSLSYPLIYKSKIMRTCWNVFEKLEKNNPRDYVKYIKYKFKLINLLDLEDVDENVTEFVKSVIREYFLKIDENSISFNGVTEFVVNFLIAKQDEFNFIFNIIKTFKEETLPQDHNKMKLVYNFFNEFYAKVQENDDVSLPKTFLDCWSRIFSPIETFNEYILMNLMVLKKEYYDKNCIQIFGEKMINFVNSICNTYSTIVLHRVSENTNKFLENVSYDEKLNLFNIIMLKHKNNDVFLILILSLLKYVDTAALDKSSKSIHKNIESSIGNCESDIVKLHFNLYLQES